MNGFNSIMDECSTTYSNLEPSVEDCQNRIVFGGKTWSEVVKAENLKK
ncbi:hypothetical protein KAU15_02205 [candidate division WOR-3 bacterium]|nr:hypothetical protein [candidate division WOR-3 bacterium]